MPIIVNAEDVKITEGDGWVQLTVADAEMMGASAMTARRWVLEAGVQGPELVQGETEQLLYIIRGSGMAIVNGEEMPVSDESVLWG